MSDLDAQIAGLERAVDAVPDDPALRVLLADALASAGRATEATAQAGAALSLDPTNTRAQALVRQSGRPDEAAVLKVLDAQLGPAPDLGVSDQPTGGHPAGPGEPRGLADVAGMGAVKQRLEHIYFAPVRNPEIAAVYQVSAGGGLLLYGPPGCGKTYLAKAVAAEIGASFVSAGPADIYSSYVGESERNVQALFDDALRQAPSVVFLDEIDALGQRRANHWHATRGVVNQLLSSMDGTGSHGVLTVAATNHPWDIDTALRRPGRLDRAVFVEPPDHQTRAGVLAVHLRDRPTQALDLDTVADATVQFSGADLAHVVVSAVQVVLSEALRTGTPRPLTTADLLTAAAQITPSTAEWFAAARSVVRFTRSHEYDDLREYMRREKLA
ncbi:MAG: AAA family ATPase [Micrococcales bacterium]|nr:AAA family ATPase [Micrococcales bacterium]MCL2668840.1 AAA family ATPase [Micrococcales bacterium]